MTVEPARSPVPGSLNAPFERKVKLAQWAGLFERLWPRLWALFALAGLFILVSLLGLWSQLPEIAHKAVLGLFALATVAALFAAVRVQMPSRDDAVRRLEARSGVPHRPASTYEDTLTMSGNDPTTKTIWAAHRARLEGLLGRMRVGAPEPRTDKHDPLAMRALMMLGLAVTLGMVGDSARDRLWSAFRFGPVVNAANARLDAWVTPPPYTGKPPVLLADGAQGGTIAPPADGKPLEIPEKSLLIVRTAGVGLGELKLEMTDPEGRSIKLPNAKVAETKPNTAQKSATGSATAAPVAQTSDSAEARLEMTRSGIVRAFSGRTEIARWSFQVIPDQPPTIRLSKAPERSLRGSVKLTYKMEDDYGVASAEATFKRLPTPQADPDTAWARAPELRGPRRPLFQLPTFALKLPKDPSKPTETSTSHEVGSHPLAGSKVLMTLVARDHAGNTGKSRSVEMALPSRAFRKPLARAVVEQRRRLAEDSRTRVNVAKVIDALTMEPVEYIKDSRAYLGLRDARHRLLRDRSRVGLKSVMDQLWHVALRLEDGGNKTEAEKRLRDAQEKLSEALKNGASDEEIQKLMQELRQALAEFLQQLAEGQQPQDGQQQGQQGDQQLSQQDLDRMLQNLENMARNGSRDQAQDMLSQLRDLLENLQQGNQQAQGQGGQQNQQLMQMMDQFGDIIGKQQQLMDETFAENQQDEQGQQGEQGQDGQQGQQGQQGQRGRQPGQGQQGQQGQRRPGQGQPGQGQPGQQPGQGKGQAQQGQPGQGQGPGQLGERQGTLGDRLGKLQKGLQGQGMQAPEQLGQAEQSMRNAQESLERGDLDRAGREQGKALEQMRQGAQQMAQEMMKRQQGNRFGQNGPSGDAPRDPLGRPRASEGPDFGTSVRVPDAIDMQTAREILEELRRRLGDPSRPTGEIDYIERLLRRF